MGIRHRRNKSIIEIIYLSNNIDLYNCEDTILTHLLVLMIEKNF